MLPECALWTIAAKPDGLIYAARPELGVAIAKQDGRRLYMRRGRELHFDGSPPREIAYLCADIDGLCIAFLPEGFVIADHKLRAGDPEIKERRGLIPYPPEGKALNKVGWMNDVMVYGDRSRLFVGRITEIQELEAA